MLKIDDKYYEGIQDIPEYLFLLKVIEGAPATYTEEEELQCVAGKLRTRHDLLRIYSYAHKGKYDSPDIVENMFWRAMRELFERRLINGVYCGDVENVTFYPYSNNDYLGYNNVFLLAGRQIYKNTAGTLCRWSGYNEGNDNINYVLTKLNGSIPKSISNSKHKAALSAAKREAREELLKELVETGVKAHTAREAEKAVTKPSSVLDSLESSSLEAYNRINDSFTTSYIPTNSFSRRTNTNND
jgi:hypothetical protein